MGPMGEAMGSAHTILGIVLVVAFSATGCATYKSQTHPARMAFQSGEFDRAAAMYEKGAEEESVSQLLFLLDAGISYHTARHYQKAVDTLLRANEIADEIDYLSVSKGTASFLITDNALPYRGEYFELVTIDIYLAIDFLMLGDLENARVALRRAHEKIEDYEASLEAQYRDNPLVYYLAGILDEIQGNRSDAYINYKAAFDARPTFVPVLNDLTRLAQLQGRSDDLKLWAKKGGKPDLPVMAPEGGQLVVFVETGLAPEKVQVSRILAVPEYHAVPSTTRAARVQIDRTDKGHAQVIEDFQRVALKQYEAKLAALTAKQVVATGAKVAIAKSVEHNTDNEALGDALLLLFYATNEADLRCWMTLPRDLRIWRGPIPAGTHTIRVNFFGTGAVRTGHAEAQVEVRPGQTVFLTFRIVD